MLSFFSGFLYVSRLAEVIIVSLGFGITQKYMTDAGGWFQGYRVALCGSEVKSESGRGRVVYLEDFAIHLSRKNSFLRSHHRGSHLQDPEEPIESDMKEPTGDEESMVKSEMVQRTQSQIQLPMIAEKQRSSVDVIAAALSSTSAESPPAPSPIISSARSRSESSLRDVKSESHLKSSKSMIAVEGSTSNALHEMVIAPTPNSSRSDPILPLPLSTPMEEETALDEPRRNDNDMLADTSTDADIDSDKAVDLMTKLSHKIRKSFDSEHTKGDPLLGDEPSNVQ